MSTTRAPMTYQLVSIASYGYAMAALAQLGPATSSEVADYLADRETPHEGAAGALGVGWYAMSVARLMTQIQNHGYPVRRDENTGRWILSTGGSREVRDAIAECYRLAALDPRPRMQSQAY